MGATLYDMSTTASDNTAFDSISQAEGSYPSAVNNMFRAKDAALARYIGDLGAKTALTGTNDVTITLLSGITAYADGQLFRAAAANTNTGAMTLDVNSIGAKAVKKFANGAEAALAAGDIQANGIYEFIYSSAAASGAGAWIVTNPSFSGQLVFPATQNASSNANTLDDYEEGTFTPAFSSNLSIFSYGGRNGTYTKIGRLVFFDLLISLNTSGNTLGGAALTITGLPFASAPTYRSLVSVMWYNSTTSFMNVRGEIGADTTAITLYGQTATTTDVFPTVSANSLLHATNGTALIVSGTYPASA